VLNELTYYSIGFGGLANLALWIPPLSRWGCDKDGAPSLVSGLQGQKQIPCGNDRQKNKSNGKSKSNSKSNRNNQCEGISDDALAS
jgi:hypothetical protein